MDVKIRISLQFYTVSVQKNISSWFSSRAYEVPGCVLARFKIQGMSFFLGVDLKPNLVVSTITFAPLLHPWMYLSWLDVVLAFRVHIWVRLLMTPPLKAKQHPWYCESYPLGMKLRSQDHLDLSMCCGQSGRYLLQRQNFSIGELQTPI